MDSRGLFYFGKRYYDPEVGRWTSVDPVPQFWDMYNYCGDNPTNRTDPDGSIAPAIAAAAISGAVMEVGIMAIEATFFDANITAADAFTRTVAAGASGAVGVGLLKNASILTKYGKDLAVNAFTQLSTGKH